MTRCSSVPEAMNDRGRQSDDETREIWQRIEDRLLSLDLRLLRRAQEDAAFDADLDRRLLRIERMVETLAAQVGGGDERRATASIR